MGSQRAGHGLSDFHSQIVTGPQHLALSPSQRQRRWQFAACSTGREMRLCLLLVLVPLQGAPLQGERPTKPTGLLSLLPAVRTAALRLCCFLSVIEGWLSKPAIQYRAQSSGLFSLSVVCHRWPFPFLGAVFPCSHKLALVDTLGLY